MTCPPVCLRAPMAAIASLLRVVMGVLRSKVCSLRMPRSKSASKTKMECSEEAGAARSRFGLCWELRGARITRTCVGSNLCGQGWLHASPGLSRRAGNCVSSSDCIIERCHFYFNYFLQDHEQVTSQIHSIISNPQQQLGPSTSWCGAGLARLASRCLEDANLRGSSLKNQVFHHKNKFFDFIPRHLFQKIQEQRWRLRFAMTSSIQFELGDFQVFS